MHGIINTSTLVVYMAINTLWESRNLHVKWKFNDSSEYHGKWEEQKLIKFKSTCDPQNKTFLQKCYVHNLLF